MTEPSITVRLVRPGVPSPPVLRPDPAAQRVIDHTAGVLRVLGGPGTGKSLTIARAVAGRINEGTSPDEILVLTFGRRAAARLRDLVVAHTEVAVRQVPVRSFESYAWSILERAARSNPQWSPPRLITGAEQDLIIRELLVGNIAGQGTSWPPALRAALPTRGFAREVRDALMRCVERGIEPRDLRRWAGELDRPVWAALASFITEYSSVTGLRMADSYDPAELVRAVVDLWNRSPQHLDGAAGPLKYVYIDEAQDLDTAKIDLIRHLAQRVPCVVIAGDPDQSVFGFRGADPYQFIQFDADAPVVTLPVSYRAPAELTGLYRSWASRLSGPADTRGFVAVDEPADPDEPADSDQLGDSDEPGDTGEPAQADTGPRPLMLIRSGSPAQEALAIAATLRQRHLRDQVPWDDMAVIVRSVAGDGPQLQRAFRHADVPYRLDANDLSVAQNPAVRALIDIVRLAVEQPSTATITDVLRSPYFRMDAIALRRLRKVLRESELAGGGVRRSTELIAAYFTEPQHRLDVPEAAAYNRLRRIVAELARDAAEGLSIERLLYDAWARLRVQEQWRDEALIGGSAGAQADRNLDAVIVLFERVSTYALRMAAGDPAQPRAVAAAPSGLQQLEEFLQDEDLPADRLSATAYTPPAVRVLTANNAKGRQWDTVVVAHLQDGRWPNLVPRDSLLGADALVDLAAGRMPTDVDRRAALLQEERRLFYVAISRARQRLVVTSVDGLDEHPSRFFHDLAELGATEDQPEADALIADDPPLEYSAVELVASLRACLLDEHADPADRELAAHNLARLAQAGVRGADLQQWYASVESSDERPIVDEDATVALSPSKLDTLMTCPLKWFLDSVAATPGTINAAVGTIVHDAFSQVEDCSGRTFEEVHDQLRSRVDELWPQLEFDAAWTERRWRARIDVALRKLASWLIDEKRGRDWVANERSFQVTFDRVVVNGKFDRLERISGTDRIVAVDLKTGTHPTPVDDAKVHPQLGVYQLAVREHAIDVLEPTDTPGGAELLFVANSAQKASLRPQPSLDASDDVQWVDALINDAATIASGARFRAISNDNCRTCAFAQMCPVQLHGDEDGS